MRKIQTESEIRAWEKIAETEKRLEVSYSYFLDGKRLVSRRELCSLWEVTEEAIRAYHRRGFKKHELSLPKLAIYDLEESEAWRMANVQVNGGNALMKRRAQNTSAEEHEEHIDHISFDEADRRKKIVDLKAAQVKLAEAEGRLVDADDLDKAMAEQAIMHRTDKTNDEKVLPILLEGKTASEISQLLHSHNQERLSFYDQIINKEFSCKETLYDVVEAVLASLSEGIDPATLVGKINA